MGADAAAFSALSERVAELERLTGEQAVLLASLREEVFGRDVHEEVLGEVRPPEPRLEQPKRTR